MKIFALCLCLNFFGLVNLTAAGIDVPGQSNGAGIGIQSSFSAEGLLDIGFSTFFSIGGILDIGAGSKVGFTTAGGKSATDFSFTLLYNLVAFKQDDSTPISIAFLGGYGFSYISGPYFEENRLKKEGQGFSIGIKAVRDFAFSDIFGIRLGLLFSYSMQNYITDLNYVPDPSAPGDPVYPLSEREDELCYGADIGLLFFPGEKDKLFIGSSLCINRDFTFSVHPEVSYGFALY